MCLNSGGENDNGQYFFFNFFRREKWQRGKNDREYYGNWKFNNIYLLIFNIYFRNNFILF